MTTSTSDLAGIPIPVLSSIVTIMILIVATILILSGQSNYALTSDREDGKSPKTNIVDMTIARCDSIAAANKLTAREAEILILLAQGRSNPYIKDALSISASTVNTRVKAEYAKLDVHSKQELLDLIYSTGSSSIN